MILGCGASLVAPTRISYLLDQEGRAPLLSTEILSLFVDEREFVPGRVRSDVGKRILHIEAATCRSEDALPKLRTLPQTSVCWHFFDFLAPTLSSVQTGVEEENLAHLSFLSLQFDVYLNSSLLD